MNKQIIYAVLMLGCVLLMMRPSLKRTNRLTRWFSYILLAVSGVLWISAKAWVHAPHPAGVLERWLDPLIPFG